jgi:predicted RNA-binding Zn ribbon-like protein
LRRFSRPPYLRHVVNHMRDAMSLGLTLDYLEQAEFQPCHCPGCRSFVDVTKSGHAKLYCGTACANRASTIRLRARQRNATE